MQKTDPSAEARAGDRTEAGVVSGLVQTRPDDAHNRRLVAQVRPADRRNPEPRERYDLVVVGAGTAGLVTAAGAAGVGAQVALVERSLLGGDCLNVGCVPSKGVIRASRMVAEARRAQKETGLALADGAAPDFAAVMARMRRIRARISEDNGETWSEPKLEKSLIDPTCQASTLRYSGGPLPGPNRLLFLNAAVHHDGGYSAEHRRALTLRLSRDDGESWETLPFHLPRISSVTAVVIDG